MPSPGGLKKPRGILVVQDGEAVNLATPYLVTRGQNAVFLAAVIGGEQVIILGATQRSYTGKSRDHPRFDAPNELIVYTDSE